MKEPKAYAVLVPMFLLSFGCDNSHNTEPAQASPSGKFLLSAEVLNAPESGHEHVYLVLRDREGTDLDSFDSLASPFHKWAIGWLGSDDVVVLYSSDIGTYAYEVSEEGFSPIELTPEAAQKGRELYDDKYR